MKSIFCILLMGITINSTLYSQVKFGDNLGLIDDNSVVEIESTSGTFVLPRMTSNQRDLIDSPLVGSLIYNTSENCLQVNVSTTTTANWQCVGSGATGSSGSWFNENSTITSTSNTANTYQNAHIGIGDFSATTIDYPLHIKTVTSNQTALLEANDPSISLKDKDTDEQVYIDFLGSDNGSTRQQALEIKNQNGGRINFFTASNNLQVPDLTIAADGKVGIGTATPDPTVTLHVVGDIIATGSASSDRRYKKNIQPILDPLQKVNAIEGVHYLYKVEDFPKMKFGKEQQIGFIAQDLEQILPEIVRTMSDGYKAVKYEKITPLLVEAIKELSAKNEMLNKEIDRLKDQQETTTTMLLKRVVDLEKLLLANTSYQERSTDRK